MRRWSAAAALLLAGLWLLPPVSHADETYSDLSYTRLLRRVQLRMLGRAPSLEEYQAVLDAPGDAAREQMIQQAIDDALDTPEFYDQMVAFGHEYMGVGGYEYKFYGTQAAFLAACPEETVHAGKLGTFRPYEKYEQWGDSLYVCDEIGGDCGDADSCDDGFVCDVQSQLCEPAACAADADCGMGFVCDTQTNSCVAMTHTVEPWWAPGTSVETIGWAGAGYKEVPHEDDPQKFRDCGLIHIGFSDIFVENATDSTVRPRCGCGPNLIYCARRAVAWTDASKSGLGYDGDATDPTGQKSALFEEPGRLFAHLIINDRPFTDLVLANYTVVHQGLQHAYVRAARQTGHHHELDDSTWWQNINNPDEWREVVVETMNPFLLADRNTKFDPTEDFGDVPGMPSAGVLTTIGAMSSFMRERPRAARWLENLTCRQFNPPPASVEFNKFVRDPATEGVCQTCHKVMDPAAIHFKRIGPYGMRLLGADPYRWNQMNYGNPLWKERPRYEAQFIYDTVMTPVSETDIEDNPDARFIDFAPPGTTLLNQTGDGTIGPLGFAKMIVASGDFDRCTVRRFYERFTGDRLDAAAHKPFIDKLMGVYEQNGKQIRPFIKWVVTQPRFRWGR